MNASTKKILKDVLPPILVRAAGALRGRESYGFSGNYHTWEEAKKHSRGYDDAAILEKVRAAAQSVQEGRAAFERDSVAFAEPDYSWPLLASLLYIASRDGGRLRVLDFGGSLGSTYFQHRKFLPHLPALSWNVVEQPHFVLAGNKEFADGTLKFFGSMDECVRAEKPNVILFSSVLQYLPAPHETLASALSYAPPYLLLDRTSFLENDAPDRLTVQKVPPKIYPASYPAWFFNRKKFLGTLSPHYTPLAEWDALAGHISLGKDSAIDKGFLFQKI